jgi:hypothetical protein
LGEKLIDTPDFHTEAAFDNGYIIVHPSYRLLAPTSGHEIVQDVSAFITYLVSPEYAASLSTLNVKVDLQKIVVSGFSGGGYPGRLAVIEMDKRAKKGEPLRCTGFISYFGMGGNVFIPPWYKPTAEMHIPDHIKSVYESKETTDTSYTRGLRGWEDGERRGPMWDWMNGGCLPDAFAGTKGEIAALGDKLNGDLKNLATVIPSKHHPVFPQLAFDSAEHPLPPTILIHGTADDKVPFEESTTSYNQLKRNGTDVEFIIIEGVNHDLKFPGSDELPEESQRAHEKAAEFLVRCMS